MNKINYILESLNKNRINESYPIDIPKVSLPIKESELKILYTYINKKYFNGELPTVRLKMAPLAKNFHGKTHVEWDNTGKIKDLLITMATINANNLESTINTLAHEMIHIWQYNMYAKTDEKKYTDDTYSFFSFGEVNTRGHGDFFKQHMDRLNSKGFNIDIQSGVTPEMELTKEFYGIVFYTESDEVVFLVSPDNPSKEIENIISNVEEKMGPNFFSSYTIFKSLDSRMLLGTRLTKTFALPKNNFRITSVKKEVDDIIHSKLSQLVSESKPEDIVVKGNSANIPKGLVPTLQRIHKYRSSSWSTYFQTAILNTEEFKQLGRIVGVKLDGKEDIPNGITQEVIDTIKKDWLDISDAEIKRSDTVSYIISDIRWEIHKKAIPINPKMMSGFMEKYNYNFKDRVDFNRFLKLLYEELANSLLKDMKKAISYNKDMDKTVPEIVRRIFAGTVFEIK